MITTWIGRRTAVTLAAIVCCVLLATGAVVAAPGTDDPRSIERIAVTDGTTVETSDGRALDSTAPSRQEARRGVGDGAARRQAMQGTPPTGSTEGQLFGVVLVLVVLVLIGAAVWGVRPVVLDQFGRATSWGRGPADVDGSDVGPAGRPTEEELLTDEERIVDLLEENGGRLKQQHVVETTEWSKAKVSRLLSSMEDDDTIVRIQLGREKLIFLSGHEPSGVRSTLGEDR